MNKEELKSELRKAYKAILEDLAQITDEGFYIQKNGKWSAAQNMAHLTLSAKLFSRALKAPKLALVYKFGLHFASQMDLNSIDKFYKSATIPSVTGFEPKMSLDTNQDYEKKEFEKYHENIISSLDSWSLWQLKLFQLPQLVFGRLSIYEMMYFFSYHIEHHRKAIHSAID
jgi:hypothetical protein